MNGMRLGIILCIGLFTWCGCSIEDERARDFSLDYDLSYALFGGKKVEGTITNISSNPANTVTLKIDIDYEQGSCDYDYVTINETLYQNDQADFCLNVADSTESVYVTINNVEQYDKETIFTISSHWSIGFLYKRRSQSFRF